MAARPVTFDPRTTAGFRQKDPGLFTNDAGQYFRPSGGQYGAEQIDYADFYGASPSAPTPPPATATPPPPPPAAAAPPPPPPSASNPVSGIGYVAQPAAAATAPVATAGPVATAPGPSTAAATGPAPQIGGGVTGNMAPVPGFDPGKLADPNHVNDKYTAAAREFAYTLNAIQPAASPQNVEQVANYLRTIRGLNATATGDKIDFGDGRGPVDVLVDKGGGQFEWQFQNGINNGTQNTTAAATAQTAPAGATMTPEGTWIVQQLAPPNGTNGGDWLDNKNQHWTLSNGTPTKQGAAGPTTPPGPTIPPTTTAGPGLLAPAPPTATAGPVATAVGPANTAGNPYASPDILAQFRTALAKRLGEINGPVDENAANIREPLSAGRDEAQRVTEQERTALAERLYAQGGLNSNAITQGIQQSSERNATGLSGLRATLITREYDARRADLNSMLAQATASGDAASARAIQEKIAELNATVQREGYGVDLAKYSAYLNQVAALNGLNG